MTNNQRIKNDTATVNRRELEDKTIKDNRLRNDELTIERRSRADKTMDENRLRNDELTVNRRELKDGNVNAFLAISLLLLVLVIFALGTYLIFM